MFDKITFKKIKIQYVFNNYGNTNIFGKEYEGKIIYERLQMEQANNLFNYFQCHLYH